MPPPTSCQRSTRPPSAPCSTKSAQLASHAASVKRVSASRTRVGPAMVCGPQRRVAARGDRNRDGNSMWTGCDRDKARGHDAATARDRRSVPCLGARHQGSGWRNGVGDGASARCSRIGPRTTARRRRASRRRRDCVRPGAGGPARSVRHGTPADPARGLPSGAKRTTAGESVSLRSLGGERPDPQARAGWRTATRCTASPGCCLLLDPCCLVSVSSVSSVVLLCRSRSRSRSSSSRTSRTTTEDTENTEQSKPKGGSRATGSCGARRAAWPSVAQTPRDVRIS